MSGNHRRVGGQDYDNQATRQAPASRTSKPDPYDDYSEEDWTDHEIELYRRKVIFRKITNLVWSLVGFVIALIGIRALLRLINADETNPFVSLVYDWSIFFVRPFLGIIQDPRSNGAVLELNALIAILIYVLITFGILRLVWIILDLTMPNDP